MILYAKLFSLVRLASAIWRAILGALTAECRVCHWSQPSRAPPLGQGGENQMRILIAVIVIVIVIRIEFRR